MKMGKVILSNTIIVYKQRYDNPSNVARKWSNEFKIGI